MTSTLKRSILATAVATLVAAPAYATNGMNMEAFGAKAGGMGGASMAYDSGNSAMMNNPATLALRKDGNDIGVGITVLAPNVDFNNLFGQDGMDYSSGGDSYLMPSISYVRNQGKFAYGIGVLAQGGMGTEYGSSLTGDMTSMMSMGAMRLDKPQRSELGFMRVMLPLAYQVNDSLAVAAQLDYVRATLDMQMLTPDGTYVDVSDNSDFNGEMSGDGWAFKLGAHYKINKEFAVGATYHSKTSIDDLTGTGTCLSTSNPMCDGQTKYNFRTEDFQWPETYAVGVAWNVNDKLMLAADIKRLMWSDTMENFNFGMDGNVGAMPQNWDDQTVYMIGGQYMIAPGVALRAGFNYAENPIPDNTLNYLFPAITEKHFTLGLGWRISPNHAIAGSVAYAPEVEQTNPDMDGDSSNGSQPITMTHSQTVWRVNYNYHF